MVCVCVCLERIEPLEKCLSLWATLLKDGSVPAVRDPKHTASAILLMAAHYTLMGKVHTRARAHTLSCRHTAHSFISLYCLVFL